jgi:hypothetical protein
MARPAGTPISFATDTGARGTITTTRRNTGMQPLEDLPADVFNLLTGESHDWLVYLSEMSSATALFDGVQAVGSTASTTTIIGSSIRINGGVTDATKVQIALDDSSVGFILNFTTPEVLFGWDPAVGWISPNYGLVVADVTVDDGYRYGYSSTAAGGSATPLKLTFPLADSHGGWSGNEVGTSIQYNFPNGNILFNIPAAAATYTWYRGLGDALTGYNGEAAGGIASKIVGISGTLDASTGDDILIEVVAQDRLTSVELIILKLPSTGVAHTGGAAPYTDTSAHSVNRTTNRYYVRTTSVATGGVKIVAVRNLTITVDKYAVE